MRQQEKITKQRLKKRKYPKIWDKKIELQKKENIKRKDKKECWLSAHSISLLNIMYCKTKKKREHIKRNVEKKMECWPSAYSISLLNI